MSDQPIQRNTIRIPNLPMGRIVDADGKPTDDELTFRQTLLTLLEQLLGTEGLVMPQQPTANITTIQNHTQKTPGASSGTVYTCQFGTFIYDSTTREVKVTVESGPSTGVPVFKVVTIT